MGRSTRRRGDRRRRSAIWSRESRWPAQCPRREQKSRCSTTTTTSISASCAHDAEPGRVLASQMARDASLNADDRLGIVLDTFRDQSNAFHFATNPAGAMVDGLVFANGETNDDWNGIWIVRTARTDEGWSAEFAIPFKTLGFPSGETVWGFNISRTIQRKLEENRWTGARFQTQFFQISEAGEITNLEGLAQGVGLDIRPFIARGWPRRGAGGDTVVGKPGVDLFYNVTPSLKLSVTANTDFGETEVDARQINLTRFSIFFPEKRSFFLQDAGVFNFATTGIDPPGGIPGNRSRSVSVLQPEDRPAGGARGADRLRRQTDRESRPNRNRHARRAHPQRIERGRRQPVGRCASSRTSWNNRTWAPFSPAAIPLLRSRAAPREWTCAWPLPISWAAIKTWWSTPTASRATTKALPTRTRPLASERSIRTTNSPLRFSGGRFRKTSIRRSVSCSAAMCGCFGLPAASTRARSRRPAFSRCFTTSSTRASPDSDNGLVESWNIYATLADWHLNSGDSLHSLFDLNPTYERLFEPFEIFARRRASRGRVPLHAHADLLHLGAKAAGSGQHRLEVRQLLVGHCRRRIQTGLSYKLPPNFLISFNANQTFASLPQGDFIARIYSSQVNYAVSPFLSFSNLIQFDNRSGNLGIQSRVHWTIEPGNEVFFVFGQGWVQDLERGRDFRRQDSRLATKLQYTFRF